VELSGGEILIQSGYPGGAVLHIYDAIFRQQQVQHILVRHEQGATHMADGYARATGKPGVVLVTSGPGATNAITGIATAHLDSIPLVVITGQVTSKFIGTDAFQEVDAIGCTRPCVKHNFMVKSADEIATVMKKAFYVATTGRPGPVVVDIPKDFTAPNVKIPYEYPADITMRSYAPVSGGHVGQVRKAVELLAQAKQPMIYAGGGVLMSESHEELRQLTRELGYPITNTLMGLGAYPASDNQFIGMLGMHGTYEANLAMHNCDVLLAVGVRFDDRVTGEVEHFCPNAKIIHVDIDPTSIAKNVGVDVPIVGDLKVVLKRMLELLAQDSRRANPEDIAAWWQQINEWRDVKSLAYEHSTEVIKPQYVVEKLCEVTNGEAYVTSDVGQHQMWAAQYYRFDEPRRWINSGGLGTMGFGLPAALGVKLAFPEADVACVTGEASIQMCLQEMSTAMQYGLPVKVINLNNRYLGMVRQWQEFQYEGRYSHSYVDALPDFVKLAESYNHVGMKIENPADVEGALKEAFAMKDKLVFLDFQTDDKENVYPMIEAGKGHHQMRMHPKAGALN